MKNIMLNNVLQVMPPDGFITMTDDELKTHFGSVERRWGVWDHDLHAIISACWSGCMNPILRLITDIKATTEGVEIGLKKSFGENYKHIDEFKSTFKGLPSYELHYEYVVFGIEQKGRVITVEIKKESYLIFCLARKESWIEAERIFGEFLDILEIL